MKIIPNDNKVDSLPVSINSTGQQWIIVGAGSDALQCLKFLLASSPVSIHIYAASFIPAFRLLANENNSITLCEGSFKAAMLKQAGFVIAATGDKILNQRIKSEAALVNKLTYVTDDETISDFIIDYSAEWNTSYKKKPVFFYDAHGDLKWKKLTSVFIIAFALMIGIHVIIPYLQLPSAEVLWANARQHINMQFLLFIATGFIAQMVDGSLGMGYGVTSATCLMSIGVNPVSVSAAVHTSEIFTSGISGYSHYKFGNVNKKLFRHLVIPGVIGAILGAVLLVFLGEQSGKWLMPLIAVYAFFLGLKILIKAFQLKPSNGKIKRVGWLGAIGGFFDSFGGGGWGPIVTSTLISRGRSPKYTIGTVSLTEFFVTLASAFTFFITVGVSHLNVVIGLLIGGGIAAPFAARLAGKLPRKAMMIGVGVMIMLWCLRVIIKSL